MNPIVVNERTQQYKGRNYTFVSERYYGNGDKRLHRVVYEDHHGPIPEGHHIHHKDHDRHNNAIENLELMTASDHLSYHRSLQPDIEFSQAARDAAAEWHGSEEGRAWHKEHYEAHAHLLHKKGKFTCKHCGTDYEAVISYTHGNDYCSNKCKTAARLKSGVDDVVRVCVVCSTEFTINKYVKTETCSKSCGAKLSWKSRGKRSAESVTKKCDQCGKEFESTNAKQKFCSKGCAMKSSIDNRPMETKTCLKCGTEFQVKKHSKKKYCGDECSAQGKKEKLTRSL